MVSRRLLPLAGKRCDAQLLPQPAAADSSSLPLFPFIHFLLFPTSTSLLPSPQSQAAARTLPSRSNIVTILLLLTVNVVGVVCC